MTPKKRGGSAKKKSEIAAAAAVAEANRLKEEEELRRLEEEEMMRKRAEEEARLRAIEEENHRIEMEKRKEEERRRAREEEERRLREREREIQQIQLLEEKDKELYDLKEKVYALNKSFAAIQQDLETESRRVAKLTNELEVTQMKLIDNETIQERKEREWSAARDKLRTENDSVISHLRELQEKCCQLETQNEELSQQLGADTELLRSEVVQLKTTQEKDDAESTVLMKLLHTELDKYKQTVANLQNQLENKERDDTKNTIMLGLLNSQLDTVKEENCRLLETKNDLHKEIKSKQEAIADAYKKISDGNEKYDKLTRDSQITETQLLREIDVHRTQVENLQQYLERTNLELESIKAHFLSFQQDSDRRDKDAFENNVLLKAELEHTKKQYRALEEEKKATDEENFKINASRTAAINSLESRMQRILEHAEKKDKDNYETITVLKAENETLKANNANLKETHAAQEKDSFERMTVLKADLERERNASQQLVHIGERKDKEYFEQLTRMTAEHDSLHRQVLQLRTQQEKRDIEYVNNTVLLNSEKENLKNKIAALEDTFEEVRNDNEMSQNKAQERYMFLEKAMQNLEEQSTMALNAEACKLMDAHQQIETQEKRISMLEFEHSKKDKENWDRVNGYKSEIQSLRAELEAAKLTIDKLEGSIAENYNYKILAEQNEMLKSDLQSYKNQVSNLNNTIATMKIESDILDNYKTKILQEQNDQYIRRIQLIEKEQRMMAPLMNEMINTLQNHGLANALQADIDLYRAHVARSRYQGSAAQDLTTTIAASIMTAEVQPKITASSPPQKLAGTASSMGRKHLESLNTIH